MSKIRLSPTPNDVVQTLSCLMMRSSQSDHFGTVDNLRNSCSLVKRQDSSASCATHAQPVLLGTLPFKRCWPVFENRLHPLMFTIALWSPSKLESISACLMMQLFSCLHFLECVSPIHLMGHTRIYRPYRYSMYHLNMSRPNVISPSGVSVLSQHQSVWRKRPRSSSLVCITMSTHLCPRKPKLRRCPFPCGHD